MNYENDRGKIMQLWTTISWLLVRASGFTAYLLLFLSVVTGLALSARWQSAAKWPRLINNELHNFLTLLSLIFTTLHVLTAWIDPYAHFSWTEVFIPFATSYRTIGMAGGILALYLGLSVSISTWLRPHIGYQWWRRFHIVTFGVYLLALGHSIFTGTDSLTWWAISIYVGSAAIVGMLLVARLGKKQQASGQAHRPVASIQKQ
jgi:predicted ferric reductase